MHDPLRHPKSELKAAAHAVESMSNADDFEAFERGWREFLTCLEKVWTKTERVCQPQRARFQPWQGQYQSLRKKDALLRYLKQARDADNHSIQDISQINPGSVFVKRKDPNTGHFDDKEIKKSEIHNYNIDELFMQVTGPHAEAIPVTNNGEWFNPPTLHLKKPVKDTHPVTLAVLGLEFYSKFLDEVEAKFFKD